RRRLVPRHRSPHAVDGGGTDPDPRRRRVPGTPKRGPLHAADDAGIHDPRPHAPHPLHRRRCGTPFGRPLAAPPLARYGVEDCVNEGSRRRRDTVECGNEPAEPAAARLAAAALSTATSAAIPSAATAAIRAAAARGGAADRVSIP